MSTVDFPTPAKIRAARKALGDHVIQTPMVPWKGDRITKRLGADYDINLKLELFQRTGTFKLRPALNNIAALSPEARAAGVTAMSAGNHAIAVACAAELHGVSAKVVMPKVASQVRRDLCESYGAEIVLADNVQHCFALVDEIIAKEGRALVHPFEGEGVALGTATLGLEICEQLPDVEVVIVPIGGGGLAAGVACAIKQLKPDCKIYGIEPIGASSMYQSFERGEPVILDGIQTIADSLGAPRSLPYSYGLCRRFLDGLYLVSDDELRSAMALLFDEMKLAVEPAAAAATAGLLGPLKDVCAGKKVCVIVCGTNTDPELLAKHINAAPQPH